MINLICSLCSRYGKRALDHLIVFGRRAQAYQPYSIDQLAALGAKPLPVDDMLIGEMLPELGLDSPAEDSRLKVREIDRDIQIGGQ